VRDTEVGDGMALLVGQTVTLRDCVFADYGTARVTRGGWLKRQAISDSSSSAELFKIIYYTPDKDNILRHWAPVSLIVSHRTSMGDNMGFPEVSNEDNFPMPVIVDFSQRPVQMRSSFNLWG
jgi:hypothetical protein